MPSLYYENDRKINDKIVILYGGNVISPLFNIILRTYMYTDLSSRTSFAGKRVWLVCGVNPQLVSAIYEAVSLIFRHIIRPLNNQI